MVLGSLVAVFAAAPASAAQNAVSDFGGRGNGSELNPYQVATRADLEMVRDCHASAPDLYFKQTANIDLSGVASWVPIGTDTNPFNDSYDGGDFEISNLKITSLFNGRQIDSTGLFGNIFEAVLKNLEVIEGSIVPRDSQATGGLVGMAEDSELADLSFSGIIGSTTDDRSFGGIVGSLGNSSLTNVSVDVQMNGNFEASNAGGVVGVMYDGSVLDGAAATGRITLGGEFSNIGGIAGELKGGSIAKNLVVTDFEILGDDRLGGLVGNLESGSTLSDAVVTGLAIRGDDAIGGAVGRMRRSNNLVERVDVKNFELIGVTSSSSKFGGLVGHAQHTGNDLLQSRAEGNIKAEAQIGGAVGAIDEDASLSVRYVAAHVDIVVIDNLVELIGGFIGSQEGTITIRDSYASGSITDDPDAGSTDDSPDQVGAFVGEANSGGVTTISESYANVEITLSLPSTPITSANFVALVGATVNVSNSFMIGVDSSTDYTIISVTDSADLTFATFDNADWTIQETWAEFSTETPEVIWVVCPLVNNGLPFLAHEYSGDPCNDSVTEGTTGPSFTGPIVSSPQQSAEAGGVVTLSGERLDLVERASVSGKPATIVSKSATQLVITLAADTPAGVQALVLAGTFGTLIVQGLLVVTLNVDAVTGSTRPFTKAQADGTIKVYARDVIGSGKIQFKVNGREIAWIRAVDATDPKLNVLGDGMVRTVTLAPGKNAIEIYRDGVRIWRAAYTGR
jgi:hypothetical protein